MDKDLHENKGTAQNKLVKDLLFNFITLTGAKCFHCNKEMNRDNFSIEHKVPWRNAENAKELFYALDNIAYSHQSCNYSAARKPTKYVTEEERLNAVKESRKKAYNRRKNEEVQLSTEEQELLRLKRKQQRHEKYLRTGK